MLYHDLDPPVHFRHSFAMDTMFKSGLNGRVSVHLGSGILAAMCILSLSFFLLVASVCAEDNTSVTVSGIVSNVPGGVYIGNSGTNNTIYVVGGGILTTTNGSVVGFLSNANYNAATVTGAGSQWSTSKIFFMGLWGAMNRLTVSTNATLVNSNNTYIGFDLSSSNNTVRIMGSGAWWTNRQTIYVGYGGSGNAIMVTNQGRIVASAITLGELGMSLSNRLLIAGTGTTVFSVNNMTCGSSGSSNCLAVMDGGRLDDTFGTLGWNAESCSNAAVIDGLGSTWSNRNRMFVGRWGSFNSLLITNGGCVISVDETHIGEQTNSSRNVAIVTGTASVWAVSNMFYVGSQGASNRLEIRNGALVTNSCNAYIGDTGLGNSNAHGNAVYMTGTNTRWLVHDDLYMGRESGWNRLELTAGARLANSNVYIGWGTSLYPSNIVDVSGSGTTWSNSGAMYISGLGNALAVSNGATVYSADFRTGGGRATLRARILIMGSNTHWFASGRAIAGLDHSYGHIILTNGARLISSSGMVGQELFDTGNDILVTGSGTLWSNAGMVTVGFYGNGNSLRVNQGGRLFSAGVTIGSEVSGNDNTVQVSGVGSTWLSSGGLIVGAGSTRSNTLFIETGAQFSCTSAIVGKGPGARLHRIVLTGPGASCTNTGNLTLGDGPWAIDNGLIISNGARLSTLSAIFGANVDTSNYAVVTDTGSVWSNATTLWLGRTGTFNRITVAAGASLVSETAIIGSSTGSCNNAALVVGAGSVWSNTSGMVLGLAGSNNALNVSSGGCVYANSLSVASSNTAKGSSITLQAGTLSVASTARVDYGSVIFSGGVFSAQQFFFNTNAALLGTGTLIGVACDNYGVVSPGLPVGRLSVTGSFAQRSGSTLVIDLAGTGRSYDQLAVSGTFTVGGTLNVTRVCGYVPQAGDEFAIVSYTAWTGSGFSVTNLPAWIDWQMNYTATGIILHVANVQSVTNGVPKAWLSDYGWTNNFEGAAMNDVDHDQMATWQEYYAGTNPTNPLSYCHIETVSNLPPIAVFFPTTTGRLYTVLWATNLEKGPWTNIPGQPSVWGNNARLSLNDTNSGFPRFYRLNVKKP